MKITRLFFVLLFLGLVLLAGWGKAAPGEAAPARQTNLLSNGSLEQPYSSGAANAWGRWHENTAKVADCAGAYYHQPTWQPEVNGDLILDGAASQHVGNQFDTWHGGVMQNVNVTSGARYRFSFWARGRASNEQYPTPSDGTVNLGAQAGIDPNGSGNWGDGDVVWGGSGSPHDNWQQFSVEATASGGTITVFISASNGGANQCRAHLDMWFDKAELVSAAPPPTNTAPPPPPPPAATNTPVPPTATAVPPTSEVPPTETLAPTAEVPTAEPTITAAPPDGGVVCLNAFSDVNGNGLHEADEGYMAGVTFTIAQNNQVLTQGVSQGSAAPLCFERIPEGSYQIAQVLPRTLDMTTAASITIDVAVGETVGLEFGSRVKPAEQATQEVSANPTGDPLATPLATAEGGVTVVESGDDDGGGLDLLALSGLGILGVAVLLLGVLIVVLLRQRA